MSELSLSRPVSSASRKALIILDQVPFDVLAGECEDFGPDALSQLTLDYVPRTTPVGHATIGTGMMPREHRVQGRRWYVHEANGVLRREDIEHLQAWPSPASPFCAAIRSVLDDRCIARKIRESTGSEVPIAAVAGKGFIPYLLGGSAADVLVYPMSTLPQRDGIGGHRLVVVAIAQTDLGERGLQRQKENVVRRFRAFASQTVVPLQVRDVPRRLELHLVMPPEWARPDMDDDEREIEVGRRWTKHMLNLWSEVDDMLEECGCLLVDGMEAEAGNKHGVLLHSRFSTDTYGHLFGCGSDQYRASLRKGVAALKRLVSRGYRTVATSDHGGRPTPGIVKFNEADRTTSEAAIEVPSVSKLQYVFRSGDHLVGYHPGERRLVAKWWNGRCVQDLPDVETLHRSYSDDQAPAWMMLPSSDQRFGDLRHKPGGGDHGCCIDPVTCGLSSCDGVVPLLRAAVHGESAALPHTLSELQPWFVAL